MGSLFPDKRIAPQLQSLVQVRVILFSLHCWPGTGKLWLVFSHAAFVFCVPSKGGTNLVTSKITQMLYNWQIPNYLVVGGIAPFASINNH